MSDVSDRSKIGPRTRSVVDRSTRIRALRPVLIALVVTVHIPVTLYRPDLRDVALSFGTYFSALISGCIAIAALPTLSVISGFLAGNSAGNLTGRYAYPAYAARKFRRLIVPMLLWGLPMVVWIYTRQAGGFSVRPDLALFPFDLEQWLRALTAYQKLPANPPLYFLRELFLAALLLPVWRLIARSVGFSALVAIAIFYCAVAGIHFDFFIRIDIYLYFFIGVFLAARPDVRSLDGWLCAHARGLVLGFVLVCAALALYGLGPNPEHYWLALNLVRLTGPVALWALATMLAAGAVGRVLEVLSPVSFTVFLGHAIVIRVAWWAWRELFGASRFDVAWWCFFVLAVALSFAILGSLWWLYDRLRRRLLNTAPGQDPVAR
ncbi:MAG: acyltransferase [Xanthomonadaceae bacterium]|nr:acyltransferase [Xanthomonadaceae bacterium]